ncbi:MAG: alpha-E domain-containing protein [Alphaproteobacteria bacterium]|nr:alpha-E domain-containing protein [Alphaproteobacteria bacterium]
MPSLLARFAEDIFWMARYLERAESLARNLDVIETYARDDRGAPDWLPVLELYGDGPRFLDSHGEADETSVLRFYVLEPTNPTSISFSVTAARQNARALRHLISTEMWTQMNIFHKWMAALTQRDIRTANVSRVCTDIKLNCQTIEGIAEGTLTRGEAWNFYQLGKYLERADQTTRHLDIAYERLSDGEEDAMISVQWNTLLRSVAGYHAYRRKHPAGSHGRDVAAFLLLDREFARAVALCVDRVTACLDFLRRQHGGRPPPALEKARRELEFDLTTGLGARVTPKGLHRLLDDLQIKIGRLSDQIGNAYFGAD